MHRFQQLLRELLLVLEAAQAGDSPEDVVVNGLPVGDDVSLNDVHHRGLELQLSLPAGDRPGVTVHIF